MERLLCIALMLFGLGACANSNSMTNEVAGSSCGDLMLAGNPPRPTSSKVAEQAKMCFANAYRACAARTLTVRQPETGTVRQFTVVAGTPCTLRQALQTDPNTPPAVADCTGVRLEDGTLVIQACSHLGDFRLTP